MFKKRSKLNNDSTNLYHWIKREMFLLKKSLIGVYCNWLYGLGKGMAHFHAMAYLKQTAQAKILISQILMQKWSHQLAK